jgi:hypothetical protein
VLIRTLVRHLRETLRHSALVESIVLRARSFAPTARPSPASTRPAAPPTPSAQGTTARPIPALAAALGTTGPIVADATLAHATLAATNLADAPVALPQAPAAATPGAPEISLAQAPEISLAQAPEISLAQGPLPLPPSPSGAIGGSTWVPRILWALAFAERHDLGPQSASDIARLLRDHAGLAVPGTNVARVFRDQKNARRPSPSQRFWTETDDQRYALSPEGRAAFVRHVDGAGDEIAPS